MRSNSGSFSGVTFAITSSAKAFQSIVSACISSAWRISASAARKSATWPVGLLAVGQVLLDQLPLFGRQLAVDVGRQHGEELFARWILHGFTA